ncbi:MAG: hypothetical protein ACREVH_00780 [Gammaproteobacteria bacterium]
MPLDPPPRNEAGEVIRHDHPGILDQDGIIRRICELQIVLDERTGQRRVSSMALKPSTGVNGGMSVDLQRQIEESGLDARVFVTTPRWTGSIRFEARQLRAENLMVGYDPTDDNPYHGQVWGAFSRSVQKRLFRVCEWFVPIADVVIPVDD